MNAQTFVRALRTGADTAYKAVMKPKEGTIVSVARVVAVGAVADVCLLDRPLAAMLADPTASAVRATIVRGRSVFSRR